MMAFAASDARPIVVKGKVIAYAFDAPGGGCIAIAADDELSKTFDFRIPSRILLTGPGCLAGGWPGAIE